MTRPARDAGHSTAFMKRLRAQLARSMARQVQEGLLESSVLMTRAREPSTTPEAVLAAELSATAMMLLAVTEAPWAGN